MTISEYCEARGVSPTQLGRRFGVCQRTAYRWLKGERLPDPPRMLRIVKWSGGAVRPDDFYGVAVRS